MPLFLQLNLNDLPEDIQGKYGSGLLQVFYCLNSNPHCESACQAFFPFMQGKLVRVIQPEGDVNSDRRQPADIHNAHTFPPKQIIGWERDEDYPGWEEALEHGISLSDEQWSQVAEQDFPRSGDKLAGWPYWIQGGEYPHCAICHERMQLVFQIDSHDHIPYMFGDLGCGHITQCPAHHEQVAFAWACH